MGVDPNMPDKKTLPVRSTELNVRLRSRLGSRQTIERTRVTIPAAKRQISKKDQASMRRLDTILAARMGKGMDNRCRSVVSRRCSSGEYNARPARVRN